MKFALNIGNFRIWFEEPPDFIIGVLSLRIVIYNFYDFRFRGRWGALSRVRFPLIAMRKVSRLFG